MQVNSLKLTIIYDNEVTRKKLKKDWGFSCIIEGASFPSIMFDNGADGSILLYNMKKLGIPINEMGTVVISHNHWDHTGGLSAILKANKEVRVYVPESFPRADFNEKLIRVGSPLQ